MADLLQLLHVARGHAMAATYVKVPTQHKHVFRLEALEGSGQVEYRVECGDRRQKLALYFDSFEDACSCCEKLKGPPALRYQIRANIDAPLPLYWGLEALLEGGALQQQQQQQQQQQHQEQQQQHQEQQQGHVEQGHVEQQHQEQQQGRVEQVLPAVQQPAALDMQPVVPHAAPAAGPHHQPLPLQLQHQQPGPLHGSTSPAGGAGSQASGGAAAAVAGLAAVAAGSGAAGVQGMVQGAAALTLGRERRRSVFAGRLSGGSWPSPEPAAGVEAGAALIGPHVGIPQQAAAGAASPHFAAGSFGRQGTSTPAAGSFSTDVPGIRSGPQHSPLASNQQQQPAQQQPLGQAQQEVPGPSMQLQAGTDTQHAPDHAAAAAAAAAAAGTGETFVQGMGNRSPAPTPGSDGRRSVFERLTGGIWTSPVGATAAAGQSDQASGECKPPDSAATPPRTPAGSSLRQQQQQQQQWKQPLDLTSGPPAVSVKHFPRGYDVELLLETRQLKGRGTVGEVWVTQCKWRRVAPGPSPLLHAPGEQPRDVPRRQTSQQQGDTAAAGGSRGEGGAAQQQQTQEEAEENQVCNYVSLEGETHMVIKDVYCRLQSTLQKLTTQGLYRVLFKRLPGVVDVLCAWVHMQGDTVVGFSYGMRWLGPHCCSLREFIWGPGVSEQAGEEEGGSADEEGGSTDEEEGGSGSHVFSRVVAWRHSTPNQVQWLPQGFSWGAVLLLLAKQLEVALDLDKARAVSSDWKPDNVLVPEPQLLQQLDASLLSYGAAAPAGGSAPGADSGNMPASQLAAEPTTAAAAAAESHPAVEYKTAHGTFLVKLCDKEGIVFLPPATANGQASSAATSSKAASRRSMGKSSSSKGQPELDSGMRDNGTKGYMAPEVQEVNGKDQKLAQTRAATFPAQLFSIALTTLCAALRCSKEYLVAVLGAMHAAEEGQPSPFEQLARALGMPIHLRRLLAWLLQLDPDLRPTAEQLRDCLLLRADVLSAAVFEQQLLPALEAGEVLTYDQYVASYCCCRPPQLEVELVLGKPPAGAAEAPDLAHAQQQQQQEPSGQAPGSADLKPAPMDTHRSGDTSRKRAAAELGAHDAPAGVTAAAPHVGGAAQGAADKKQRV